MDPEIAMGNAYIPGPEERDRGRFSPGWRPFLFGILAAVILAGVYIVVLALAEGFAYALDQYLLLWKWMTPLIVGFGFQVGLFVYLKGFMSLVRHAAFRSAAVWTSTGISTGSMVACCVHHVADVLPVLGLSAAAVLFGRYQILLLALGIVSNVVGIFYMLHMIQKHGEFVKGGIIALFMRWNMKAALLASTLLGGIWLLFLAAVDFL